MVQEAAPRVPTYSECNAASLPNDLGKGVLRKGNRRPTCYWADRIARPRRSRALDLHHLADFIHGVGWELEEVRGVFGVLAEEDKDMLAPLGHAGFSGDDDALASNEEGGFLGLIGRPARIGGACDFIDMRVSMKPKLASTR